MKNSLITIVVPCFNVEKYIKKCCDSIMNQTYKNIEVLLVNDGSTDSTESIIDDICNKDKRFKKINKTNGGLSSARNAGIKKCKGEYICFIDSDDYVDYEYIEKLYKSIIENEADISVCDFWYFNENNKWTDRNKDNKIFSKNEALIDFLSCKQELEVMTWNKLYKVSLFKDNNILFPDGKVHEDNFTTYKLFYYSNKISLINDKLYYYLQRNNSIMGSKFNSKRFHILKALEETKQFFKDNTIKIDIDNLLICYDGFIYIKLMNNILSSNYNGIEKKQIKKHINNNYNLYRKNNYISKKVKIELFLCKYFHLLYKIIFKIKRG